LPIPLHHTTIKYNYYFKNNFKYLVKKNKEINYIGPEKLIKDNSTRWLSAYNILERFIYFKEEIEIILEKAKNYLILKENILI